MLRQQVWDAEKFGYIPRNNAKKCRNFANLPRKPDCRERTARLRMGSLSRLFSAGHMRSPVSTRASGECDAIAVWDSVIQLSVGVLQPD